MKAIRAAVRKDLKNFGAGDLVLAACSGGADSVALALALLDVSSEYAIRVGVISIDHQLQAGSRDRAVEIVDRMRALGAEPAEAISVHVGSEDGPEAAARRARYAALDAAAQRFGAVAIYLGHTASDQAETVLLGLSRGSGSRSLSGMAGVVGLYRRPLLHLSRDDVRSEVSETGFPIWNDPHNEDVRFTRVRARKALLLLENELGPGLEAALVRSAALLRDDADALDHFTDEAFAKVASERQIDIAELMAHPRAVRTRVIKRFAEELGLPALNAEHIEAVEALASRWKGQGPVALPGHVDACREGGLLKIQPRP